MMADHEEQDVHGTKVAQIKNAKSSQPSTPEASADATVRLRKGTKSAQID